MSTAPIFANSGEAAKVRDGAVGDNIYDSRFRVVQPSSMKSGGCQNWTLERLQTSKWNSAVTPSYDQ